MGSRRFARRGVLAWVAGAALAGAAHAQMSDDVAVGVRAEAEGRASASGVMVATEVEIKRVKSGLDQAKGPIESVDADARSLRVGGVTVVLDPGAGISGADGAPLDLAQLGPGLRAKAEGSFRDGVLHARSLEAGPAKPDEAEEVEIEGIITQVDRVQSTFQLLGLTVRVAPHTEVELD
jgi:hypothetical protein